MSFIRCDHWVNSTSSEILWKPQLKMDCVCFQGINGANKHNLIPALLWELSSQTRVFSCSLVTVLLTNRCSETSLISLDYYFRWSAGSNPNRTQSKAKQLQHEMPHCRKTHVHTAFPGSCRSGAAMSWDLKQKAMRWSRVFYLKSTMADFNFTGTLMAKKSNNGVGHSEDMNLRVEFAFPSCWYKSHHSHGLSQTPATIIPCHWVPLGATV